MGIDTASVSPYIAKVQTLLKDSGLEYSMHANGTTVGREAPVMESMGFRACSANQSVIIQKAAGTTVIELPRDITARDCGPDTAKFSFCLSVMKVIGQAHGMLHDQGVVRVHTDIRVGSRSVHPSIHPHSTDRLQIV